MFDFMGTMNNKYRKHEVQRLSLHVGRVKFRPLTWRNTHPYVLVDRVEDVTAAEDMDADERTVALYGYVRGSHLKSSQTVHLLGGGDFPISSAMQLPDPCSGNPANTHTTLSRKRDALLYAPMTNVGRVSMDTAGELYIELKEVHYSKPDTLAYAGAADRGVERSAGQGGAAADPMDMIRELQDAQAIATARGKHLTMWGGSAVDRNTTAVEGEEEEDWGEEPAEDEDQEEDDEDREEGSDSDQEDEEEDEDNDGDDEPEEEEEEEEETAPVRRSAISAGHVPSSYPSSAPTASVHAAHAAGPGARTAIAVDEDIMVRIYGPLWATAGTSSSSVRGSAADDVPDAGDSDSDDLFAPVSRKRDAKDINALDSNRIHHHPAQSNNKDIVMVRGKGLARGVVKQRFVTAGYGEQAITAEGADGEETAGDWEDLEAIGGGARPARRGAQDDEEEDEEAHNDKLDAELRAMHAGRKAAFKASFDSKYDQQKDGEVAESDEDPAAGPKDNEDEAEAADSFLTLQAAALASQAARNASAFREDSDLHKGAYIGFKQGAYVRILLRTPKTILSAFSPARPIILGGLMGSEVHGMGYTVARVKRHRWTKGVLKSNDPLVLSVGWRRYQTMPVYHMIDENQRSRFLKYTPEHMHCLVCFYGPLVPPNSAIFGYKAYTEPNAAFRIALTGVVLEQHSAPVIVKKVSSRAMSTAYTLSLIPPCS